MFRFLAVTALAAFLSVGRGYCAVPAGANDEAWMVDTRVSDVQLISDATTDYGNKKITYTIGYVRTNGEINLDEADVANSKVELHIYPADAVAPPVGGQAQDMNQYMAELPNRTLISFHSKQVTRTNDGKLKVTGELVVMSADRDVEIEPTEAYSGPTFGPTIVHRVVREASFVFSPPADQSQGLVVTMGSADLSRDNDPQVVKAVLDASWPTLVRDETCHNPAGGPEDYRGFDCTGHYLSGSGLPPAPVQLGEDYPGAWDYNHVVGSQLQLVLHLQLSAGSASANAGAM